MTPFCKFSESFSCIM